MGGWLYLATVIDIASRRIVGYAIADHLRTELVADALADAIAGRNPGPGVIFDSDRGCQVLPACLAEDGDQGNGRADLGRTRGGGQDAGVLNKQRTLPKELGLREGPRRCLPPWPSDGLAR